MSDAEESDAEVEIISQDEPDEEYEDNNRRQQQPPPTRHVPPMAVYSGYVHVCGVEGKVMETTLCPL